MNANLLRRVNWLWKHRHTHDGDTTLDQIRIIRETVESQGDQVASSISGAFIHLTGSAQTVASGGEALEWAGLSALGGIYEFDTPVFPATSVTIPFPGYYNVKVAFDWDTFTGGGSVWIVRTRNGLPEVVYPEAGDPGVWSSSIGSVFVETAHAIPCRAGDILEAWVDPGGSSQDLVTATLSVYLVDRTTPFAVAETGLVDAVVSYDLDVTADHQVKMTSAQTVGDMMVMALVCKSDTWSAYPTGWSTLIDNYQWNGGRLSVLYKVSDGTETDVIASTSDIVLATGHAVWVVRSNVDYSTNAPTAATPVKVSTTSTIDPPAVTPSQGAGNYMIFPVATHNGGRQRDVTDGPDGYDLLLTAKTLGPGGGTNDPGLVVFEASVVVTTSADPNSITWDNSGWIGGRIGATTIAVKI